MNNQTAQTISLSLHDLNVLSIFDDLTKVQKTVFTSFYKLVEELGEPPTTRQIESDTNIKQSNVTVALKTLADKDLILRRQVGITGKKSRYYPKGLSKYLVNTGIATKVREELQEYKSMIDEGFIDAEDYKRFKAQVVTKYTRNFIK